ncbi:MAG TPA: diguanylate cyclase [Aromatoleum sp.]|uniref:diguanylate cyclase n=1 Tax=Aromatoleum sp. TaxID=2307007 RepID=UPI002B4A993F|nr:diguanylate cyclase [Aromatoleum sp.]HJV25434.1 diguanylate cyclase [Aromatoleum sp.]
MSGIADSSAGEAEDPRASLLHALVDQSPALIAVRGCDGEYLYANSAFAGALGVPPESLLGRREDELSRGPLSPHLLRVGGAGDDTDVTHSEEEAEFGLRRRRFVVTRFPIRDAAGDAVGRGMIATELASCLPQTPNAPPHATADEQTEMAAAEARHAELLRALEQMERLAYTDRLTGAWNRRHLEDAALLEMSRAERHGHPVSLMILDVDHFKDINDHFGHAIGDYVLVELVRSIRTDIRRADTITRWGGEEFVVLAPDASLHEAEQLAEKLRDRVADSRLSSAGHVTVSIGVAEYQCGESFEDWFARADHAMYRAKSDGRNRVECDPLTAFSPDGTRKSKSPIQLVWRNSYCSGDANIDRQHRQLFDHANHLLQGIIAQAPREHILDIARVLMVDISTHFAEEERLHARIGFPERVAHAAEHAHLLDKANRLFREAGDDLPVAEVFHFLAYEVVAQHLVGADRHYFPYLEATRPTS